MNGMIRKIYSIILVGLLLVAFGGNAMAENPFMTYSGQCGDNLTWEVSTDRKTLTIGGSGEMYDYNSSMPWNDHVEKIEKVIFEGNITKIGENAFRSHNALTSITIPDGVTSIGYGAFEYCSKLQEVSFPKNLKEIEAWAFSNCDGIKSVKIPEGMTKIIAHAFSGCSGLMEISLPKSVTEVEEGVFNNCSKLGDVYYAGSAEESLLIEIGDDNVYLKEAVWHCLNGDYVYGKAMNGQCGDDLNWKVSADRETLTISGNGEMYDYESGTMPWSDHAKKIEKVIFEGNITKIGDHAFCNHKALASITMPNSVTSIGNSAFQYCSKLQEVNLPKNLKEIKAWAFQNCTGIKSVTIPEGMTKIVAYAFYGCSGLTEISLPKSVVEVGEGAFNGCRGLDAVYYAGSVEESYAIKIGYDNAYLKETVWHCTDGNCQYGQEMSGQCGDNLIWEVSADRKTLTISGNGEMYDYNSSMPWNDHAGKIEKVIFEGNVTKIGENAFRSHNALTSITIPDSVTSIGYGAFEYCSKLQKVSFPKNLKEIKAWAFSNCDGIKSVKIPEGMTKIIAHAFSSCSGLMEISLPKSVTEVGEGAFNYCSKLADVYYAGSAEESYAISIGYDNVPLKDAVWHYDAGNTPDPDPDPNPDPNPEPNPDPSENEELVKNANLPKTGDDSSLLAYGMLLMLSAAALLVMKKKTSRA